MKNNGKQFEKDIQESCKKQGILFERYKDNGKFGYSGDGNTRFSSENPCDGHLFHKGLLVYLELKSTVNGSISFNKNPLIQEKGKPKPSIKTNQIKCLMDRSKHDGVMAGLMVNYYDRETKTGIVFGGTFFIEINKWLAWAEQSGKKSMNLSDARSIGIGIESRTMIKNKRYDMAGMITKIKRED